MSSLPSVNLNNLYAAFGSNASGIDVASAVNQILDADRAIERQWQAQQQAIAQQTSALNQLSSLASSLTNSLNSLQDPLGALMASNITSTQPSVVTASAAAGTVAGSHVVMVQNLASTAAWYSDAVASSSTSFAPESFDLTIGSGSSQTTATIAVGSGINTPTDLASYINGLNLGVTASVVTDANGARVAIVANASGNASDFSIEPTPNTSSDSIFTRAATGMNASLTVDGVPVSSATNTVTGVINGVTLNLNSQAPGSEVVLTIGPDTNSAEQAINSFVSWYNALVANVNSQFAYDATSQSAGPLSGDSTVRLLQSSLLAAPSYSGSSGTIATLGSLGITMNNDGTLSLNTTTLDATMQNNPSAVQQFFQGTSANGFVASVKNALGLFTDPSEGAFTVDLNSLNSETNDLQDQINNYENYLSGVQTSLTAEYNQANILLLQLPQMQKQLDAILGSLSSGNNG
jgi:flagellar hook-associated protein 2